MVLILDGNSVIGAQLWSNLCNLISLRQLDPDQSQIEYVSPSKDLFLYAQHELSHPSYTSTKIFTQAKFETSLQPS